MTSLKIMVMAQTYRRLSNRVYEILRVRKRSVVLNRAAFFVEQRLKFISFSSFSFLFSSASCSFSAWICQSQDLLVRLCLDRRWGLQ